jgi:surfactin synthase thioesterase subunit
MVRSSWLTFPQPRDGAAVQLLCFPHAGGGASLFHPLAALLPPSIGLAAVQLPGREARLAEPLHTRMAPLIHELADALAPALRKPTAFFGHSMGALIAYELARELVRRGQPAPASLIVSGRRAPTFRGQEAPLHTLPDDAFVAELVRRYDAIPQAILAERDLMALFLPILKADFAVFETHRHEDGPPLPCPIAIYGGDTDPQTAEMAGWATLCGGPATHRVFPGGHFYLVPQRQALAAALAEDLGVLVAAA